MRQPHDTKWNTFRTHGPTNSRFDHHLPSAVAGDGRSILYAASEWHTCVAEVFQDDHAIHTHRNEPRLVAFTLTADISLLDLGGLWPTRARASAAISSAHRSIARVWSRTIYDAFPDILGLRYNSAMNAGRPAFALYERAEQYLSASPLVDLPLSHPEIADDLDTLAHALDYDLF